MCTSTVDVADAVPEQPEINIVPSTVDGSGMVRSVPFAIAPHPPAGFTVHVNEVLPDPPTLALNLRPRPVNRSRFAISISDTDVAGRP